MKTNHLPPISTAISAIVATLGCALCVFTLNAADITATGSGNWSSTVPDAPWPGGIVPGTNDDVDVEAPFNVTVDSTASVQFIYGSGTVTMAAGSTLNIVGDPAGAQGTYQLTTLDTSAPGNTVIYSGNPFWARHQNYYNLVFSNTITPNLIDFYNGTVNSQDPAFAMTIAGDMTVIGKIKVQQGADFTVLGNLIMGTNSQWDCSSFHMTVMGNTTMGGLMLDLDGGLGSNYFNGPVTITAGSLGWNVSDVTHWGFGASLTNNGLIVGKGYGSIAFDGNGVITGKPFSIPTITVNGTCTIASTITLTTNTPTLNGTLVFDLANTNQLILKTYPSNPLTLYYNSNLQVINTGPAPISSKSYKLFDAASYDGFFSSETFPSLPAGLSWEDDLLSNGSIAVTGTSLGSPTLSLSRSGNQLTLSWDSATFPGYSVQGQTNSIGLGSNWGPTSSGTTSPFTVPINPANPAVFFRLVHP